MPKKWSAALLALLGAGATAAQSADPQTSPACSLAEAEMAVRKAEEAVESLKSYYQREPQFMARLSQADGALIASGLGTARPGVFLVRDGVAGQWSYPAFFEVSRPGPESRDTETDAVFLFLSEKAVDETLNQGITLTHDGDISFVAPGPGLEGGRGLNLSPDVMVFASEPRADFSGTEISPAHACTAAYYDSPLSPADVFSTTLPPHQDADRLREALLALPPPRAQPM